MTEDLVSRKERKGRQDHIIQDRFYILIVNRASSPHGSVTGYKELFPALFYGFLPFCFDSSDYKPLRIYSCKGLGRSE
jgi:hypothetical protein